MNLTDAKFLHFELGSRRLGGTMQVFYLLREMHRSGLQVALVTADGSPLHEMLEKEGVKVYPIRFGGDADPSLLFKSYRAIKDFQPDLIHIHSRKGADTFGALAARMASNAIIITSRRVDDPIKKNIFNKIRFGSLCDHIVAVSKGIVAALVEGGVNPNKIDQVYSSIQAKDYQSEDDCVEIKRELGIPEESKVVTVISQLIIRKGHRFLFQAAPDILAENPECYFLILGEGELESQLRQQAEELGINNRVVFAGYRDDIGRMLKVVDILVHPATMEGFANVAMQAMAAEVPVVSSAVGGMPESVRDNISGLLVPPCEPSAIADAVNKLLGDDALRAKLGCQGKQIVESEFTVQAMVEGTKGVYKKLLS